MTPAPTLILSHPGVDENPFGLEFTKPIYIAIRHADVIRLLAMGIHVRMGDRVRLERVEVDDVEAIPQLRLRRFPSGGGTDFNYVERIEIPSAEAIDHVVVHDWRGTHSVEVCASKRDT